MFAKRGVKASLGSGGSWIHGKNGKYIAASPRERVRWLWVWSQQLWGGIGTARSESRELHSEKGGHEDNENKAGRKGVLGGRSHSGLNAMVLSELGKEVRVWGRRGVWRWHLGLSIQVWNTIAGSLQGGTEDCEEHLVCLMYQQCSGCGMCQCLAIQIHLCFLPQPASQSNLACKACKLLEIKHAYFLWLALCPCVVLCFYCTHGHIRKFFVTSTQDATNKLPLNKSKLLSKIELKAYTFLVAYIKF